MNWQEMRALGLKGWLILHNDEVIGAWEAGLADAEQRARETQREFELPFLPTILESGGIGHVTYGAAMARRSKGWESVCEAWYDKHVVPVSWMAL